MADVNMRKEATPASVGTLSAVRPAVNKTAPLLKAGQFFCVLAYFCAIKIFSGVMGSSLCQTPVARNTA